MKTKYIKVSVSKRHPEKLGDYLTDKGKALFITTTKLWHIDKLRISPNWWLEEKPDYEDEMKEVLLQLVGCHTCGHTIPDWLNDKAEELLTKIKTES